MTFFFQNTQKSELVLVGQLQSSEHGAVVNVCTLFLKEDGRRRQSWPEHQHVGLNLIRFYTIILKLYPKDKIIQLCDVKHYCYDYMEKSNTTTDVRMKIPAQQFRDGRPNLKLSSESSWKASYIDIICNFAYKLIPVLFWKTLIGGNFPSSHVSFLIPDGFTCPHYTSCVYIVIFCPVLECCTLHFLQVLVHVQIYLWKAVLMQRDFFQKHFQTFL